MPKSSALELIALKRELPHATVWLLTGEDSLLRQRTFECLLNRFLSPEEQEFNQETLNASETSVSEILSQATTLPFLASCRVVSVREVERLSAESQRQLAERLESLPETTRLVLIKNTSDTKLGKESRAKGSLESRVAEVGMIVECNAPAKDALKAWVVAEVQRHGKKIEPVAAGLLCELIGPDLARMANEIDKMVLYMDEAPTINKALVQKLVQKTTEETIFRLTDAVAERKVALAVQILEELMSESEDAYAILGMLTRQFRLLTQARWLIDLGYLPGPVDAIPETITARLPRTHNILPALKGRAWLADKLIQQARAFTQADLTNAFDRLLATDLALKRIEVESPQRAVHDPKMAMQLLVVDLCESGRPQPARAFPCVNRRSKM